MLLIGATSWDQGYPLHFLSLGEILSPLALGILAAFVLKTVVEIS